VILSDDESRTLDALIEAVLDQPAGAQADVIARFGRENPTLADILPRVQAILGGVTSRLDSPAFAPAPQDDDCPLRLEAGQRLGAFEIVGLIGRGGMGEVYRAQRVDGQFEQAAAVKVIRADASRHMTYFSGERQILARLNHPDITRIYDGGVLPGGEPYMVTELVTGKPITTWCRENRLTVPERVRLFLSLCDVIASAHRSLVVHRDLKPQNIFITDEGRVKVLDFGVAGLLSDVNDGVMAFVPLSLDFAAPEQVTRDQPVGVAVDIYALGVVLFELLTDKKPWDTSAMPLAAALRAIEDRPVAVPSAAVADGGAAPASVRQLAGDLDAIVGKALQPHPDQRYRAIDELMHDIRRHLAMRPVAARAGGWQYRVWCFLKRRRFLVAGSAVLLVVTLAGLAGVGVEYVRAVHEARRATTIKTFLVSLFTDEDPSFPVSVPRNKVSADELMRLGVERIDREFAADPDLRLELLNIAGEIYGGLSDPDGYDRVQAKILEQDRVRFGPHSARYVFDELQMAKTAIYRQDWDTAGKYLDEDATLLKKFPMDRELWAEWWNARGEWLRSRPGSNADRAEAYRHAIAYAEGDAASLNILIGALGNLATIRYHAYDLPGAQALYARAISVAVAHGQATLDLATAYSNLASIEVGLGHQVQAERLYDQAAGLAERLDGRQQQAYWFPVMRHATLVHRLGDRARAHGMFDALLATFPKDWSADSMRFLVLGDYGTCLVAEGQSRAAIPVLDEAIAGLQKHPFQEGDSRRLMLILAQAYADTGMNTDAEKTFRDALAAYDAHEPDGMAADAARERWIGFRIGGGKFGNDEQAMLDALLAKPHPWDAQSTTTAMAWADQATILMQRRAFDAADAALHHAQAALQAVLGLHDVRDDDRIAFVRAQFLSATGHQAEALSVARAVRARATIMNAPQAPFVVRVENFIVQN